MNGRPQSMLQVPPGRGTEPTRAQLVRGSEPVEKVHLRLEWVWSCWASKRPPWGAAPKTPGEQGPSLQAQGLNRPSLPAADGWVWPGVWFPCRGGCAGVVFGPLLGRIQWGPDTTPWPPGLPGDCPRASGPLWAERLAGFCPGYWLSSSGHCQPLGPECLSFSFLCGGLGNKTHPTARTSDAQMCSPQHRHHTEDHQLGPAPATTARLTQRNEHP